MEQETLDQISQRIKALIIVVIALAVVLIAYMVIECSLLIYSTYKTKINKCESPETVVVKSSRSKSSKSRHSKRRKSKRKSNRSTTESKSDKSKTLGSATKLGKLGNNSEQEAKQKLKPDVPGDAEKNKNIASELEKLSVSTPIVKTAEDLNTGVSPATSTAVNIVSPNPNQQQHPPAQQHTAVELLPIGSNGETQIPTPSQAPLKASDSLILEPRSPIGNNEPKQLQQSAQTKDSQPVVQQQDKPPSNVQAVQSTAK